MRAIYDAFGRGDIDTIQNELFAPEITFHTPGNNQIAGDHVGIEAVLAFFGKIFQLSGGTFHIEVHDVTGSDDHAVGLTEGVMERDGKTHRYRNIHVAHFKGNKLVEFWENPEVDKFDAAWA